MKSATVFANWQNSYATVEGQQTSRFSVPCVVSCYADRRLEGKHLRRNILRRLVLPLRARRVVGCYPLLLGQRIGQVQREMEAQCLTAAELTRQQGVAAAW